MAFALLRQARAASIPSIRTKRRTIESDDDDDRPQRRRRRLRARIARDNFDVDDDVVDNDENEEEENQEEDEKSENDDVCQEDKACLADTEFLVDDDDIARLTERVDDNLESESDNDSVEILTSTNDVDESNSACCARTYGLAIERFAALNERFAVLNERVAGDERVPWRVPRHLIDRCEHTDALERLGEAIERADMFVSSSSSSSIDRERIEHAMDNAQLVHGAMEWSCEGDASQFAAQCDAASLYSNATFSYVPNHKINDAEAKNEDDEDEWREGIRARNALVDAALASVVADALGGRQWGGSTARDQSVIAALRVDVRRCARLRRALIAGRATVVNSSAADQRRHAALIEYFEDEAGAPTITRDADAIQRDVDGVARLLASMQCGVCQRWRTNSPHDGSPPLSRHATLRVDFVEGDALSSTALDDNRAWRTAHRGARSFGIIDDRGEIQYGDDDDDDDADNDDDDENDEDEKEEEEREKEGEKEREKEGEKEEEKKDKKKKRGEAKRVLRRCSLGLCYVCARNIRRAVAALDALRAWVALPSIIDATPNTLPSHRVAAASLFTAYVVHLGRLRDTDHVGWE